MPVEKELGKLIFNGTILFLSISFGLFTLSLSTGEISVSSIVSFITFTILVILSGIASLVLSFFGIKRDSMILIYCGGVCFLIMIVLLTYAYSQMYISTLEQKAIIKTN